MKLTASDISNINAEVIAKLKEFISDIEMNGVEGLGIPFDRINHDSLLDKATDAFAENDVLAAIVLSAMDDMDCCFGEEDAA